MKTLPNLERLRRVYLDVRFAEFLMKAEKKLIAFIKQLKNVREIFIDFSDAGDSLEQMIENFGKTLSEINERQNMRCDFMFYVLNSVKQ